VDKRPPYVKNWHVLRARPPDIFAGINAEGPRRPKQRGLRLRMRTCQIYRPRTTSPHP